MTTLQLFIIGLMCLVVGIVWIVADYSYRVGFNHGAEKVATILRNEHGIPVSVEMDDE